MIRTFRLSGFALVLLAGSALGDATGYKPHATGFTLPNAQQAVSATSAQTANYATTAGSTGYATNAGTATTAASATYATSSGSAVTATTATNATNAAYATNADSANDANYATNAAVASQAAGLTAGNNCPAGTALSVTKGVLGCVSAVTSITGNLNGSQVVGDLTNVGNIYANGYVAGRNGLYSDTGVYSAVYADRGAGSSATFLGNAVSANSASSANFANSSASAGSVTGTVNGAQIVGDLTNVGNIYANGYVATKQSLYSDGAVYSNGYAARNGTATAAFYGNASSSSSAATVTGQVNGAQIVGDLNVGSINASGNVSTNGYVYGVTGLFTDNAVFSNTYADRLGGSNAYFAGNAASANYSTTAGSTNYATTAGSTNYAANTDVGILRQTGPGDGSTFYCDTGYYLNFYDLNVNSTNNAFFYECLQNGH